MTILQAILNAADAVAHGFVEQARNDKDYMVIPQFIGMSQDKALIVIMTPFRNDAEKKLMLEKAREAFREHNVIAYAMISEAWTASIASDSEDGRRVARGEGPRVMPSQDPNRREVIIVAATDGSEAVQRTYAIERDAAGCMTGIAQDRDERRPEIYGPMLRLLD